MLGVLDSLIGLLALVTIAVIAISSGAVQSWADVRTILALAIVLATLPLISQSLRPIRRSLKTRRDRIERIFDYVVPPVFLGFAAVSMLKAANGMSGLELISPEHLNVARWAVAGAILARLAFEDIAAHA